MCLKLEWLKLPLKKPLKWKGVTEWHVVEGVESIDLDIFTRVVSDTEAEWFNQYSAPRYVSFRIHLGGSYKKSVINNYLVVDIYVIL